MATHSSTGAWEIPWTEEPGGLQQSWGRRVRHDLVTKQQQQHSLGDQPLSIICNPSWGAPLPPTPSQHRSTPQTAQDLSSR